MVIAPYGATSRWRNIAAPPTEPAARGERPAAGERGRRPGATLPQVEQDSAAITIAERVSKLEGFVAAYIFGSRARGTAGPQSDVDVAIWLARAPKTFDEYPFELAGELEQALGVPVDVVVLNGAPCDLVHRVLRDGRLVAERDRSARIRLEVRARNDYFDLRPMLEQYRAGRRAGSP